MTQTAYKGTARVWPSEVITINGKTEKGRDLEIYLAPHTVHLLQKVFEFSKTHKVHLGHSFWHIKEGKYNPCDQCKNSHSDYNFFE